MPAGACARAYAEHIAGHDFVAMQHDQPVHRAHELRLTGAPAHAAWNRQAVERGLHDAGQQVGCRLTGLAGFANEPRALVAFFLLELGGVNAALRRERDARLRQLAILVGNADRRALENQVFVGLCTGEVGHQQAKPARACIRLGASKSEVAVLQQAGELFGKRVAQLAQRSRRHFLGAQLDQEIGAFLCRHFPVPPLTDSTIGKPSASRLA